MAEIIKVEDLPAALQSADLIAVMVAGANATASRVAPCLASTDPAPSADQLAEAKLILIGAVKRWTEAGSGALQHQIAGPFQIAMDTRQKASGFRLWPAEITDLQEICADPNKNGRAFAVDTVSVGAIHMDICDINFGGLGCSCGADIAGVSLFEYSEDYF